MRTKMSKADYYIKHEQMIKDVTKAIKTGIVVTRVCEEKGYSRETIARLQKLELIPYAEPMKNKPKPRKYDRLIFDLTYSDWLGDLKPFQNRWNSIGFNTNFMKDIKFKELRFFSLGMGVGYGFSTISSDQRFMDNKQIVEMINLEKSGVFDYATIHAHRFYVPFELRFYTKNWNRFKFVIGGSAGLLTGFNQTLIGRDGLKQEKSNLKSNVQVLNYGIHCRFGLRNIAFFGSYQINSLFRERGNPNIHPLQLGLSLSLF